MTKLAKITWVDVGDGGRIPPPIGTRYTPLIEIQGMDGIWSSDFICTKLKEQEMLVEIRFLSDVAPFKLLQKDMLFKLYEGSRLVATGIVLN